MHEVITHDVHIYPFRQETLECIPESSTKYTDCWRGKRQKSSSELLLQEWWSKFAKVLKGYHVAHWESWSCAFRSSCGYISSSWCGINRMSVTLLNIITLKVRSASFRYVAKSFWSKLNFSNISEFDVVNDISPFFLPSNLCLQIIVKLTFHASFLIFKYGELITSYSRLIIYIYRKFCLTSAWARNSELQRIDASSLIL